MKLNRLASSDLWVSEIGYGCMSLPLEDASLSERLLHRAVDAGVTFFDTADLYHQGANESFVGQALKPYRNRVIIATKVGNRFVPGQSGWTWDPSKAYILQAVEDSLKRLQTDTIDLLQLHGGTLDDPLEDVIETFEHLLDQGKIRAYGISSIRPNVIRAYVQQSNIVSVMSQYSLLDRRPEETVLPLLSEAGISVIARGPVAKGYLSHSGKLPDGDYLGHSPETIERVNQNLSTLARDGVDGIRASNAQLALRYALSHPAVATTIPGASRLAQLEENISAAEVPPLTPSDRTLMQSWTVANAYEAHR